MQLIVNDLTKVYGTSPALRARLLNDDNIPQTGVSVSFTINNVSYTRVTDSDGYASLNINLPIGVYSCIVECIPLSKKVTVTVRDRYGVSLLVNPLTKTYGVAGALKATLYGEGAKVLANRTIQYKINGVVYNRVTNNDGTASLNINLRPGTYPCEVKFLGDAEYGASTQTVNVTVKADTFIDGIDVDKKYSDAGFFQCAVYDQWERLNPVTVDLTVNGVRYTRTSGNDGLVKLNIRLPVGEYPITVRFNGDAKHNGSSLTKLVRVREDVEGLTVKASGGYTIPGSNQGRIESKIYTMYWSYEDNKKSDWVYDTPNWDKELSLHPDYSISFTNYEITETDGRVKTAKFTTSGYIDLTYGRAWVYITSPYHENFGGRILKVDYDKSTGLYTYQCQDGRRQYISKRRMMGAGENTTVYELLQLLLMSAAWYKKGNPSKSNLVENSKKYAKLLSGLHPIGDYDNLKLSPILKGGNPFKQKVGQYLAYDSTIDQITNLAKNGQYPIDVWFDPSGICHIDPIDLDKWLKQGIRLVHSDLISYKYGFDTTNIITGVTLKSKDDENASGYYDEWYELTYLFGANFGSVDPVTTSTGTTSTSNSSSTSTSSGTATGNGVVINPKTGCRDNSGANIPKNMPIVISIDNIGTYSQDMQFMRNVKSALQGHGYTNVTISGVGPGYHNKDVERASPNTCCLTIFGGYCACTFSDYWGYLKSKIKSGVKIVAGFTNMPNYHANKPSSTNPNGTHLDKITWLPKPWDMSCGISGISNPGQRILNAGVNWVYGDTAQELADNLAKGNSGGSSTTTTTSTGSGSSNTTTTTTVTDSVATYNKALEAMSQSVRDLLSFEIELPLNNPIFKNLHTNQMLWTELPKEFKLTNLEKIFKILPSYKVNRGVPYQENRWYVEKVVIKHDGKGPIAKITVNPFPSSYSVYSNAVKGYAEAYDQAFKQNTTNNNTTTSTSTPSDGTLAKSTGNTQLDNLIKGWISGKTTDLDKAIAIHNGLKSYGVKYSYYPNFPKSNGSISVAFQKAHAGLNCGDTSVLTVGSMRAAGLESYIGFRCDHEHFFTVIVINGTKYYSDLTANSGQYSQRAWNSTWQQNKCHSKYTGISIH